MNVETKQTILIKSEQKPELNKYHKRTWDSGIVLNTVLLMWPLAGFCCCSLLISVLIKGVTPALQCEENGLLTKRHHLTSCEWECVDCTACWRGGVEKGCVQAGCEGSVKIFPTCFLFPEECWKEKHQILLIHLFIYFYCSPQCVPVFSLYIYIYLWLLPSRLG